MPLPSAMRVVAGVLITLGLALGGIVALKKLLLKTDGRFSSQGMRILGRAVLGSSLRAHLLQVEASRVLVVEGRSGIAITVLPCAVQDDERKAK